MDIIKPNEFLRRFPNHVFRFIDQTGGGRAAVISGKYRRELNTEGYEAYFTVNGFANFATDGDCKLEHMTNLNAFFVDIDGRKDVKEIEDIRNRLEPTFILETMRGYHLYWMLDEVVYRDEMELPAWNDALLQWEKQEQSIVTALKGDPVVKDATRILRIPGTYYWKKSGDAWKEGTKNAPFKIRILHSDESKAYSMADMKEAFPYVAPENKETNGALDAARRRTKQEKEDFFAKVNEKYPIPDRPSFKLLASGAPGTIPDDASRNGALLVLASLAREAGWEDTEVYAKAKESGWHGTFGERGGDTEVRTTIDSAYRGGYTFGRNNPYIEWNMTDEERKRMSDTYTLVMKDRKEADKVRFSTYESELFARNPHIKRNEAGMLFNYDKGVYRAMSRDETNKMVLEALYDDHMWGYRTGRCVSDKLLCLLSIVPKLVPTDDKGLIVNVRNGLLNIVTHELKKHDPDFVSLVQFPVDYDPEAKCPAWEKSVAAWTEGDEGDQKALILQQYAGYCLSSSMKYGKALFIVGDGGNGKSTYADTVGMLIGDDAVENLSLEDLNEQYGMASLIGKRLNIVEEVSSNYLHSDKLKKLASGEAVTASLKYRDSFKFRAQCKFIFAVNQMPRVDDSSFGTERRLLVVHFRNNFRDNPDVALRFAEGTLAGEMPGILNWALEGARTLHETGKFATTEEQRGIIQDYREENSSVDGFIAECLVPKNGSTILVKDLYEVYVFFCKRDGRKSKAKIGFTKELKVSASKGTKFVFHERRHGGDEPSVSGMEFHDDWARNFESTFTARGIPSPFVRSKAHDDF